MIDFLFTVLTIIKGFFVSPVGPVLDSAFLEVWVILWEPSVKYSYLDTRPCKKWDQTILLPINILMFLHLLIEKNVSYIYETFFPKIYLWIPYSTESQLVEHLQSNGKWNAKLIIK